MDRRQQSVIREHDGEGRLVAAGMWWYEMQTGVQFWFILIALLDIMFLPLVVMHGSENDRPVPVAWMVGVFAICIFIVRRFGKRPRELVFHSDGRMTTPHGLPVFWNQRQIRGDHSYVASIEATRAGQFSAVIIYSSEGEILCVAHCIAQGVAHLIAVQLTKALRELRESMAMLHSPPTATRQDREIFSAID